VTLRRPGLPWPVAFAALGLIWGCSFLFIKVAVGSFSAVQVGFGRLAIGAITLLVITALTRTSLPRSRRIWAHLAVTGLLFCSLPGVLFAFGEQHVSSILAGIINGATPLMTLLVVLAAFPEEHPTRERMAGLAVGFAGVLVVLGVWNGFAGSELEGVLACIAAITCYGLAYPWTRRYLAGSGEPPVAIATGQVVTGALFVAPLFLVELAGGGPANPTGDAIAALVALGMLSSGIAYVLAARLIIVAGSTVASTVTYVTPVVAVVVGILVLGEPVEWYQPLGAAIVLLGVAIAQGRLHRRTAPALPAAPVLHPVTTPPAPATPSTGSPGAPRPPS
jgi:drug/metabolite transporter (DMT)-like permease